MSNTQQIAGPIMTNIGRLTMAPASILAIDWSQYDRATISGQATVYIAGPHILTFKNEDADALLTFWEQATGQARVQPAPPGLHLSNR